MIKLSTNLFCSFMTDCYESVKSTVKRCHAYASNYDAHQLKQYAAERNYDPYLVTDVTLPTKNLILHNKVDTTNFGKVKNAFNYLTSSVICGAFTAVNSTRNKKMQIFVQKQPEMKMERPGPIPVLIERNPEYEFRMKSIRCMIRDSSASKDKETDFDWGFVESDLSVKFESTLRPLKPPKGLFKKTRN